MNSTCKTCLLAEESQDHILWRCPFAIDVWTNCSAWLKVDPTPQASSNLDGYFCLGSNIYKTRGGICLAAILWTIWTSRNELVLRGEVCSISKVVEKIKFMSLCWTRFANLTSDDRARLWEISPPPTAMK